MIGIYLGRYRAVLLAGILVLTACSGTGTHVNDVWSAPGSGSYSMGRTMVIVLTRTPAVSDMVERILVRQLQDEGVSAEAWHLIVPGVHGPGRTQIVPVVTSAGYTSVLVVNVLQVKQVEREYPAAQVARAEVKLFSVLTGDRVWTMTADTYVRSVTGTSLIIPQEEDVQHFAEAVTDELIRSGIL
ncbi:hypothetical protein [Microbulbifer elongatus]|uniref:hypothetical protein n=1 Tax=Microbulbifer elongatus TaxID=86173 RepID=UPI001CFDA5FE|nr:hypothetical protein [Microbulbifer elongatus]